MIEVTILKVTVDDIANSPRLAELAIAYEAEAKDPTMPPPNLNIDTYRAMEKLGLYHAFAAYGNGQLVGLLSMSVVVLPRYSVPVAMVDSVFVDVNYRKNGTGAKLIEAAEQVARETNAWGVMISAPFGGRLIQVLPKRGYKPTNQLFFKSIR